MENLSLSSRNSCRIVAHVMTLFDVREIANQSSTFIRKSYIFMNIQARSCVKQKNTIYKLILSLFCTQNIYKSCTKYVQNGYILTHRKPHLRFHSFQRQWHPKIESKEMVSDPVDTHSDTTASWDYRRQDRMHEPWPPIFDLHKIMSECTIS